MAKKSTERAVDCPNFEDGDLGVEMTSPMILRDFPDGSIRLVAAYSDAFSPERFATYADILTIPSESLREQPRTLLRLISLIRDDGEERACALKIYRYPNATGARTIWASSKAKCVFRWTSRT